MNLSNYYKENFWKYMTILSRKSREKHNKTSKVLVLQLFRMCHFVCRGPDILYRMNKLIRDVEINPRTCPACLRSAYQSRVTRWGMELWMDVCVQQEWLSCQPKSASCTRGRAESVSHQSQPGARAWWRTLLSHYFLILFLLIKSLNKVEELIMKFEILNALTFNATRVHLF